MLAWCFGSLSCCMMKLLPIRFYKCSLFWHGECFCRHLNLFFCYHYHHQKRFIEPCRPKPWHYAQAMILCVRIRSGLFLSTHFGSSITVVQVNQKLFVFCVFLSELQSGLSIRTTDEWVATCCMTSMLLLPKSFSDSCLLYCDSRSIVKHHLWMKKRPLVKLAGKMLLGTSHNRWERERKK